MTAPSLVFRFWMFLIIAVLFIDAMEAASVIGLYLFGNVTNNCWLGNNEFPFIIFILEECDIVWIKLTGDYTRRVWVVSRLMTEKAICKELSY